MSVSRGSEKKRTENHMSEPYRFLKGYFDKQIKIIEKLYPEIKDLNLSVYENRYVFSLKTQQFYTAIEDLLKQVAKAFENHIDSLEGYHRELLMRLNTDIPELRPAFLSKESFLYLDKLRAFRHFIRHAYNCELEEAQLVSVQSILNDLYPHFKLDFKKFEEYLDRLIKSFI